jgi:hypothetical protein
MMDFELSLLLTFRAGWRVGMGSSGDMGAWGTWEEGLRCTFFSRTMIASSVGRGPFLFDDMVLAGTLPVVSSRNFTLTCLTPFFQIRGTTPSRKRGQQGRTHSSLKGTS